ncbi:MAG: trimethylamine--corrinoid methyltransferase [Desulfobacteraceae bacterium]|nr:trimethylamine--corrinoid methyltransferase [Desulfobacteraceae bacterium]
MNLVQMETSRTLLGSATVDMLMKVHDDALWILENMGVGCKQPDMLDVFRQFEADGKAIVYDNRVYIMSELVRDCLAKVPGIEQFFVPRNSFFVGGTAPYVYDDAVGVGGVLPTPDHVKRIAQIAEANPVVAGMGRGLKLKNEVDQIDVMVDNCTKPLYYAVTSERTLERAKQIYQQRGKEMIVFCLTRPPLEVNENFSDNFVQVVRAGLPVFISAMPMAGISAPYCYNGVLAMTHAEVLFGICTAQLLRPGHTCIHAGFPTIADPRFEYNPNYGLKSHFMLNLLQAHLNLILDLPTFQSGCTTNEEHPTERALDDARTGQALCKKYGFHMMRHSFGFLRHLVDFSFAKMEAAIRIAEEVTADEAPDVKMPIYDERGMESIQRVGLGMYMDDSLTTANIGCVFVD